MGSALCQLSFFLLLLNLLLFLLLLVLLWLLAGSWSVGEEQIAFSVRSKNVVGLATQVKFSVPDEDAVSAWSVAGFPLLLDFPNPCVREMIPTDKATASRTP